MSKPENRSWSELKIPVAVWLHLSAIIDFVMPPDDHAAMTAFLEGDDCMVSEKRLAFERMLVESQARLALALEPMGDTFMRSLTGSEVGYIVSIGSCLSRATPPDQAPYVPTIPEGLRVHLDAVRDYITPPTEKATMDRLRHKRDEISVRHASRLFSLIERSGTRSTDVCFALGAPLQYVTAAARDCYLRAIVEKHSADSV